MTEIDFLLTSERLVMRRSRTLTAPSCTPFSPNPGCDDFSMTTILASTDAPNLASIKVLERLGFARTEERVVKGLDLVFFALRPTS